MALAAPCSPWGVNHRPCSSCSSESVCAAAAGAPAPAPRLAIARARSSLRLRAGRAGRGVRRAYSCNLRIQPCSRWPPVATPAACGLLADLAAWCDSANPPRVLLPPLPSLSQEPKRGTSNVRLPRLPFRVRTVSAPRLPTAVFGTSERSQQHLAQYSAPVNASGARASGHLGSIMPVCPCPGRGRILGGSETLFIMQFSAQHARAHNTGTTLARRHAGAPRRHSAHTRAHASAPRLAAQRAQPPSRASRLCLATALARSRGQAQVPRLSASHCSGSFRRAPDINRRRRSGPRVPRVRVLGPPSSQLS